MAKSLRGPLADSLKALLAYRNTPDHPPEPIKSNWTTTPANDNADPTETADYSFERKLHVTPSVQEIMRHVATGPIVRAAPQNGASQGPIVQIGKLHFSDGESRERAFVTGPDGAIVQGERKMPLGAMLRTREKSEAPAGGKGYNDVDLLNSDKFYASVFGTAMPRFIKRGDRRNGPSLTPEQSRALIDEAMANTPVLPPVTYYPPGLPCGSDRVADSFLAFKKVPTGKSGSVAWQDIGQTIENAKVWKNLRKALNTRDRDVLDAAMRAQSYTDILPGGSERGARKRGKRALLAANDNLAEYVKMFAA